MTTIHKDLIRRLRMRSATQLENFGLDDEAADALEAMQADAERYRWLRGNYTDALALLQAIQMFTPEQLDAAIDAVPANAGAVVKSQAQGREDQ